MRLTIAAAFFAAVSLSLLLPPAFAANETRHSIQDTPNRITRQLNRTEDLGVNVTQAGNTRPKVQKFLASLKPDTRRLVLSGCRHYLKEPVQAQGTTILFCKLAM